MVGLARFVAIPFTAPAGTRRGTRLRTAQEEIDFEKLVGSLCGDRRAEVDTDEDGVADDNNYGARRYNNYGDPGYNNYRCARYHNDDSKCALNDR